MRFSLPALVAALLPAAFAAPSNPPQLVRLRIEGRTRTIYEAPILSRGTTVTTPSGGSHKCDGTNNGANPTPGATCTTALNSARALFNIPFDGTYSDSFDDFFITSIGGDTQTSTEFWGLLRNFQFTPTGGCQTQTATNDEVLWAFDAFSKVYFLKLAAPVTAKKGQPVVVTVTDGTTGVAVPGASVGGQTTGADGKATVVFDNKGVQKLKAERADSLRSNAAYIVVT